MNSTTVGTLSDEHVVLFFRKLKNELNCSCTGKIVVQVRQVLSKIRGTYSVSQLTELVNKTPPLLHFLFIGGRYEEEKNQINHLDELADSVYREDQQTGKKFFKTEIEALGSVIIILKRLQTLFAMAGMQAFSYVLSTELQQAVIEEAA